MKLRTKLISSILSVVCGAAMVVFAVTTFSWFSSNRQVDASGIKARAYIDETAQLYDLTYSVYGFDIQTNKPSKETGKNPDLKLGDYDMIIKGRNTYNRRTMRIPLTFPNGHSGDSKLKIEIECEGPWTTISEGKEIVAHEISNLVQFKFYDNYEGRISSATSEEEDLLKVYNECRAVFDDTALAIQPYTFVNFTDIPDGISVSGKNAKLTVEVEMPSLLSTENITSDFFIEINYNEKLVEYFRYNSDYEEQGPESMAAREIHFEEDIIEMTFSLTKTK